MAGGGGGFRWVRGNVAVAGVLGALVGFVLALLSAWGPLGGLEPLEAGLGGLAFGGAVFMAWYSAGALLGWGVRGWTRAELLEAAVAYLIVVLSTWVGFYNAVAVPGG